MENKLQVFSNSQFGRVRTVEKNGKVLFCGTDIAKALGYAEPQKAVRTHCRGVSKMDAPTESGIQQMNFISEGDVYRLIVRSRLPAAEEFERWVFDEVLPSIRETGGYGNQLDRLEGMLAQFAESATVLMQAAAKLITVAEQLSLTAAQAYPCGQPGAAPTVPLTHGEAFMTEPAKCKLETFPRVITDQVDAMLENMMEQQALNFCAIARFCTVNGYAISSPAVKNYYLRHAADYEN